MKKSEHKTMYLRLNPEVARRLELYARKERRSVTAQVEAILDKSLPKLSELEGEADQDNEPESPPTDLAA